MRNQTIHDRLLQMPLDGCAHWARTMQRMESLPVQKLQRVPGNLPIVAETAQPSTFAGDFQGANILMHIGREPREPELFVNSSDQLRSKRVLDAAHHRVLDARKP